MAPPQKKLEVLILAAGKGTRMYSALPKVLHSICGKTLLMRTAEVVAPLASRIVVVSGFGRDVVLSEIERIRKLPELKDVKVVEAFQEEQRGTGHAARVGSTALSPEAREVLIVPGDIPLLTRTVLENFVQSWNSNPAALSILSCNHPAPAGFGRIVRDAAGSVKAIVEEKDCSEAERKISEINSSIYLVSCKLLKPALDALQPNNAQGELYLTDIVAFAVNRKEPVTAHISADISAVTGANTRWELSMLEKTRRMELVKKWMDRGVTFEDPQTAYLEDDVQIGQDSFIGANTRIRGKTLIGERVVIEGNSLIEDSEIAAGTVLHLQCYVRQSKIGKDCEIGPFAQLRPETELSDNVKIGNFVEVKKSKLGTGAKANHLAYIGDAEVGGGSNIGAGTIVCNYDGKNKSKTQIGEKVFIGSNSTLVAPLTIGAGAYIGAGSTITKEVPPGALGIGRSRQSNIEGWVERKNLGENKKGK